MLKWRTNNTSYHFTTHPQQKQGSHASLHATRLKSTPDSISCSQSSTIDPPTISNDRS